MIKLGQYTKKAYITYKLPEHDGWKLFVNIPSDSSNNLYRRVLHFVCLTTEWLINNPMHDIAANMLLSLKMLMWLYVFLTAFSIVNK